MSIVSDMKEDVFEDGAVLLEVALQACAYNFLAL